MSFKTWESGDQVKNRQDAIFEVVSIRFGAVMLSRHQIVVTATQAVLQELGYRWFKAKSPELKPE